MKLYFYFLETWKIRCAECEVEEKPKTYKPVNKFPEGYYGFCVKKEDIGRMVGCGDDTIVLTKNNIQTVADVFRRKMKYKIVRAKQDIAYANDSINQCNKTLSMIDEWEKQNSD